MILVHFFPFNILFLISYLVRKIDWWRPVLFQVVFAYATSCSIVPQKLFGRIIDSFSLQKPSICLWTIREYHFKIYVFSLLAPLCLHLHFIFAGSLIYLSPLLRFFWTGCIYGCKNDGERFGFFCHAALEFLLQGGFHPVSIHLTNYYFVVVLLCIIREWSKN